MAQCLLEGNEAIALGAMAAGCRFFAGYPITPATSIFNTMLRLLPPEGGVCIQGEDEIASIGYCLGASMAGLKAMTATSGPGISLYSEHISFAIGSEIPIVIVDVQRLGPSTGSATLGADGDIQFLRWSNSGGLPVVVLAPVDVRDCYTLTIQAFNLAETYRCPVFIASNKEVGLTRESIDMDAMPNVPILNRTQADPQKPFLPFAVSDGKMVPDFLPIGSDILVRQTSSTHGPDGYITTDPEEIAKCRQRLAQKLYSVVDHYTFYETLPAPGAKTLIITYGVTARAAKVVYRQLLRSDHSVSLLILKTLWPVPDTLIRETADAFERVVVLEMNLEQYVREIRRVLPGKHVEFEGQMNGKLITPERIREVIENE